MDKNTYNSIREYIGISNNIIKQIDNIQKIIEIYPNCRTMTLEDVKEYLYDRYLMFENKIKETAEVQ